MKTLTCADKPTIRCIPARSPHGVKGQLVIIIYPDGTIGLREHGRRKCYLVDAATLYVRCIQREIAARPRRRRRR